jgi:hypothetical protein
LAILAGLSVWSLISRQSSLENPKSQIIKWLRDNLRLILNVELLFFLAFAFLALVRASNPELTSAEKPMELMFINAILRSPNFPPNDAWLSGYAISYYYFGYVITAMLAKLTGVPGTAAHNLMTALVFALGAIGAYGILYNLLSLGKTADEKNSSRFTRHAFLAPLFLLIISNAEGFLEVLHRRGLFWSNGTSRFWTWLNIKDLSTPPAEPFGWVPDRYLWWWRASRVVSDYDLSGGFKEIIDEFPMFSFIHADLHPHVLAIPFGLLAIAAALNLFLAGDRGSAEPVPGRLAWGDESFRVQPSRQLAGICLSWSVAGWTGLPQHLGYPRRGGAGGWGVCPGSGSGSRLEMGKNRGCLRPGFAAWDFVLSPLSALPHQFLVTIGRDFAQPGLSDARGAFVGHVPAALPAAVRLPDLPVARGKTDRALETRARTHTGVCAGLMGFFVDFWAGH